MGNLNFDATTVNPADAFDPLPPGWYAATITKADLGQTKAGDDKIALEFELIGPDFAGRKAWTNLNIGHSEQKTREISQRQLSAICHSIGKLKVSDTDELLGGQLRIKLDVQPAREVDGRTFAARNEVKGYKGLDEKDAAPAAKPAAPKAAAAPAKQPWKR